MHGCITSPFNSIAFGVTQTIHEYINLCAISHICVYEVENTMNQSLMVYFMKILTTFWPLVQILAIRESAHWMHNRIANRSAWTVTLSSKEWKKNTSNFKKLGEFIMHDWCNINVTPSVASSVPFLVVQRRWQSVIRKLMKRTVHWRCCENNL